MAKGGHDDASVIALSIDSSQLFAPAADPHAAKHRRPDFGNRGPHQNRGLAKSLLLSVDTGHLDAGGQFGPHACFIDHHKPAGAGQCPAHARRQVFDVVARSVDAGDGDHRAINNRAGCWRRCGQR